MQSVFYHSRINLNARQGQRPGNGQAGLTLIELMVGMAIMIIFGSALTVSFRGYIPRYRVRTAANDLYASLQLARLTAVREHVNCTVAYLTGPERYLVHKHASAIPPSGPPYDNTKYDKVKEVNLASYKSKPADTHDVIFGGPGGEINQGITFDSRGFRLNPGPARVFLTSTSNIVYYQVVSRNISGDLQMQKWDGSAWN